MTVDLATVVKAALVGELKSLHEAVAQIAEPLSDEQIWARPVEPGNSLGNLILHLTGNLNHFVGAQLGRSGYVRDREREFRPTEAMPKAQLLAALDDAVATFCRVVEGLPPEQLVAPHPEARFGPVVQALVHLVTHFALHRGQMSYIVRLLPAK
jgi:uncharacterized damage-inducible protein DinB